MEHAVANLPSVAFFLAIAVFLEARLAVYLDQTTGKRIQTWMTDVATLVVALCYFPFNPVRPLMIQDDVVALFVLMVGIRFFARILRHAERNGMLS